MLVYQRVHILESGIIEVHKRKPADRRRNWPSVGRSYDLQGTESVFNLRAKHGKEVIPWTKGEKLKTENPNH